MGLPVGTIWQVGIETSVANQRCLNILHYKTTSESSIDDITEESESIAQAINQADGIIDRMKDFCSTDTTFVSVSAQAIRSTTGRRPKNTVLITGAGEGPGAAQTANVAAVLTKRTQFAGRWAVGSFHIAGVSQGSYENGVLLAGATVELESLGSELLANLTPGVGGGVYSPVLLHPVGQHDGSTALLQIDVQPTVRVMRRRTVGVGI